ncbi:toxin-antitoxin system YwqK family antitoxin [Pseudomonas putida]|uniref:toxin-antitoxin system YwqK family antitoxin n=1 Tax=Pseudomonas putida TaxID=303 RepID=UPI001575A9AC|nr:hypothetical protein [Pseudomonas putida]NTY92980.1 hypothetical protein [Pseudomonas putida]NTZ01137.1 hypothetical protein [Pseudomonas putida]NTZ22514.1 hypothetical protein [Pseudomonas putida]NTZ55220.1 hypothetical protein [Pseudomonas putida]NTZ64966.1 hypothetical protein [Pseudomonas putida]
MKARKIIAGTAAFLSLGGCSESQLDYRNAQISNGLIYSNSENKPFTGLVTNLPEDFLRANSGYNDTLFNLNQILSKIRSEKNMYMGRAFVCDAQVEDGFISGSVSCYQARSRTLRYSAEYKSGNIDGVFQIFAIDGKTLLAKTSFTQDQVDGATQIWSPNTGKLIYLRNTRNGKPEGLLENYDENTGQTTYRAEAKAGYIVGIAESFSADGKRQSQVPYDDGVPHGIAYEWDANTGTMTKLITFDHGAWTGENKKWTADGTLVSHQIYNRNVLIEDKLLPAPSENHIANAGTDQCVEALIEKFRSSNGEDALIRSDQVAEWESDCGKPNQADWME